MYSMTQEQQDALKVFEKLSYEEMVAQYNEFLEKVREVREN